MNSADGSCPLVQPVFPKGCPVAVWQTTIEAVWRNGKMGERAKQSESCCCLALVVSFLTHHPTRTIHALPSQAESMGRLTVQVVVRSWGLAGLPSTLTVEVDDRVSEEGFQVSGDASLCACCVCHRGCVTSGGRGE